MFDAMQELSELSLDLQLRNVNLYIANRKINKLTLKDVFVEFRFTKKLKEFALWARVLD